MGEYLPDVFERHMEGMKIENNPLGSESTLSEEVV